MENTFIVVCIALAAYMTSKETYRYLKNDDMSTIGYKNFAQSPGDTYPTFSICFHDDENDDNINNKGGLYAYFKNEIEFSLSRKYNITNHDCRKFVRMLKGESIRSGLLSQVDVDIRNVSEATLNAFTIQLKRLYQRIEFKAYHPNDSLILDANENFDAPLPFYVSYQDPVVMCFSRKGDDKGNIIRISDSLWLHKKQLERFEDWTKIEIFIHYPDQLLRVFDSPIFVSYLKDLEWEKPSLNFKISQVSILRKRPDANTPCDPHLQNDDLQLRIKVSEQVGCIPFYWTNIMSTSLKLKTCKTPEDMQKIWSLLRNVTRIQSSYHPPCNEMKLAVAYVQQKTDEFWAQKFSAFKDHGFLGIEFQYMDKNYQEIINEQEFGLESLWSTVGGFIGIFVGTSVSQAPRLIVNSLAWLKNKMK